MAGIMVKVLQTSTKLQTYFTSSPVGSEMGSSTVRGNTVLACNHPTQPPTLHGTGNEQRPICGDALWQIHVRIIPHVN